MQPLNHTLLTAIVDIAQQAGEHLKRFYAQSVTIQLKADHTPVTEADLFVSQFVTEKLKQLTPDIPVLSEENCKIPLNERKHWQEYWIIDPLDGTQQFIDRTDQFSVVIGLVQQNRPMLGVIHAPVLDKTYYAMKNHGAFLVENGQAPTPLSPCKKQSASDRLLITIGTTSHQKVRAAVRAPVEVQILPYGSSSLKAGLVAEGKANCYMRFGDTGEWDTAVAEVLLGELGGQIFDLTFQPLTYNQREDFVNPHFVMVGDATWHWAQIFQFHHEKD